MYWVASGFNPANPVSRALQLHTREVVHRKTQLVVYDLLTTPTA